MLTRRHILRGGAGLAAAPLFLNSFAAEAAGFNAIVVAILLSGGNDGLNTVVPLSSYDTYAKLRTPVANPPKSLALAYTPDKLAATRFDSNPATPAETATQYAFAPSMAPMRALYATGKLAVLFGIGLPPNEQNALSHSDATNDWLTGQVNIDGTVPPGWLGLALAGKPAGSLGATASLAGDSALVENGVKPALILPSPIDNFGIDYPVTDAPAALKRAYTGLVDYPTPPKSALAYTQGIARQASDAVAVVADIARKSRGVGYPRLRSYLDYQLKDIARLIIGGSGIRGFFAEQGGYDTHSQQALSHGQLLNELSYSMSTFYNYLKANNVSRNVIVVTLSDFGRRPEANQDMGTDHGGSSVSFVLGDRVKGGTYGDYPSINKRAFDGNGNLKLKIDFRNMISDVITAAGGNPVTVLGKSYASLGMFT